MQELDGRPPRASGTLVKTASYERLRSALAEGLSPVFVTGPAGSGKTTLLRLLEQDWSASRKPVCLITLREVYRETDLFYSVERSLVPNDAIPPIHGSLLFQSSASEALHAAVDLVRTFNSPKPL